MASKVRRVFIPILSTSLLATAGCVVRTQTSSNVVNISETDFGKINSFKKGTACLNNVLGFINWGDYLVTSAVAAGKLRRVRFVESEFRSYFVFTKNCTIVYGE
jgi:hypothetical protein